MKIKNPKFQIKCFNRDSYSIEEALIGENFMITYNFMITSLALDPT